MKRKSDQEPRGEGVGNTGELVEERAQRHRRLCDHQDTAERVDLTPTIFDPQRDCNLSFSFGNSNSAWLSDSTPASANDANRGSVIDSSWLDAPTIPTPCHSNRVEGDLPLQASSTAPVLYGMVVLEYLSGRRHR
jgi:hypothetical protein